MLPSSSLVRLRQIGGASVCSHSYSLLTCLSLTRLLLGSIVGTLMQCVHTASSIDGSFCMLGI